MKYPISSITVGPRKTNIELLRILAMFLVLVVHADFASLGAPSIEDITHNFIPSFTRIIIEAISISCVNVFIFISGWFKIKPSIKGLGNFLFQCAYFLFGIYIVMIITGQTNLNLKGIAECFCLTPSFWFIKAYLGLYILSPILNNFVEKSTQKQLGITLASFYIFQTIYGFSGAAKFIEHGYSTFSFIGIYLLAQYINRYKSINYKWGGVIFCSTVIINSCAKLLSYKIPISIFVYDNPFVVIAAVGLFIFFNGLKIKQSSVINFVAKSCFAVYLLHAAPSFANKVYRPICQNIFESYSGIECLGVFILYLISIYLIAVLLDIPRRIIWKWLSKKQQEIAIKRISKS